MTCYFIHLLPSHGFRTIATQSRLPGVWIMFIFQDLSSAWSGQVHNMFKQESSANFQMIPSPCSTSYRQKIQILSEPCREGRRAASQSFASAEGHWDQVGPKSASNSFRWPRSSGWAITLPICGELIHICPPWTIVGKWYPAILLAASLLLGL